MLDGYIKDRPNKNKELKITRVVLSESDGIILRPVRKVPRTFSSLRVKSTEPSGNSIHFESKIEYDVFLNLKFDNEIDYIVEQPVRIEFEDELGNTFSYTPDLLVHFSANEGPIKKPCLIEIKYQEEVKKDSKRIQVECEIAKQLCSEKGWQFKLILDTDLNEVKLRNIKFLQIFEKIDNRPEFDQAKLYRILDDIRDCESSTPKKLIKRITNSKYEYKDHLPYLWHLIRWRKINADLKKPLNMESKIWAV